MNTIDNVRRGTAHLGPVFAIGETPEVGFPAL